MRFLRASAAVLCVLVGFATTAQEQVGDTDTPGIYADRIVFGQSAAFSGPAQELGIGMRTGLLAAFKEVNDAGGVHGRRIELVALDDGYEPEAAIANTQKLIDEERVFALIGAVGTPTSRAAVPVAAIDMVPYIAPFTGAGFLRDHANNRHVVNMRASYAQETEAMVHHLLNDLDAQRIAILFQDDSFGHAGFAGATAAMDRRGLKLVGAAVYERNTLAIKTAVLDIRAQDPDAVIIVGSYQPSAEFTRWARHIGMDRVFINISFVGSNALARDLGPDGRDVVVVQVVPFPQDESLEIAQNYRDALAAQDPQAVPGFVSFEGYLAGRLAHHALEAAGPDVTREGFFHTIESLGTIDLGGFELSYGLGDNQGSDSVFLTVLDEKGRYRPISDLSALNLP